MFHKTVSSQESTFKPEAGYFNHASHVLVSGEGSLVLGGTQKLHWIGRWVVFVCGSGFIGNYIISAKMGPETNGTNVRGSAVIPANSEALVTRKNRNLSLISSGRWTRVSLC
jgi:hypothetical protein